MHDATHIGLTPTARLARARKYQLARTQLAAGITAWPAPRILSFSAWLQQLRAQAVLQGLVEQLLLSAEQARWLWQQLIDKDVFVGEPKVAQLAERAWQQLHEYDLPDPAQWPSLELSDDSRAFRQWVWLFRRRCEEQGWIDPVSLDARLPELIAAGQLPLPQRIELIGFELPLTPLQRKLLQAVTTAGCVIDTTQCAEACIATDAVSPDDSQNNTLNNTLAALGQAAQRLTVQRFADSDAELQAAANWARQRLQAKPEQSIAIVVPDLDGRIDQVDEVMRQVFDAPAFALQAEGQPCWHISLGKRLSQWPMVSDALLLLGLDFARLEQPRIGRLLRSPYILGWPQEAAQRSACFAFMQRHLPYLLSGEDFCSQLQEHGNGQLLECVQSWQQLWQQQPSRAWPSQWAGVFQETLQAFGFARGRALDSREYQLLQRWHQLLEAFAAMDVVTAGVISRTKALALLNDAAGNSTFRERNPGCPVEILGVVEALGTRFDALWITTLDSDSWPSPARREALLPGSVQALIPSANHAGSLQQALLQLHGLLCSAEEVRGSLANEGSSEQAALTALLPQVRVLGVQPDTNAAAAMLERLADDIIAPPLATGQSSAGQSNGNAPVRGGTGIIRDQSACPFRAFALHRLHARELRPPRPGLNAMERGSLLHQALELFWRHVPDQAALKALANADALTERIERAASQALHKLLRERPLLLSAVGQELELQCLQRALQNWLLLELQRPPFAIRALEQEVAIELAGLRLRGKMDRIDEIDNGSLLIDYKSGQVNKSGLFPEPRISDPQLPLYALALQPPPQAIAFASLAPAQMGFAGLAADDSGITGITALSKASGRFKAVEDWPSLLQDWEHHLHALAADFSAGQAAVNPRKPADCQYCHLHALCRIHERTAFMEDTEVSAP